MAQDNGRKQPTRRKAPTRRIAAKKGEEAAAVDADRQPQAAVGQGQETEALPEAQPPVEDGAKPGSDAAPMPAEGASDGAQEPATADGEADNQEETGPKEHKQPTRRKAPAAPTRRKVSGGKAIRRADADADETGGEARREHRRVWPFALVLALFVAFTVCSLLFCWQKWWRFDDYADIQGAWRVESTGDIIVIDAHNMKLTQTISYEYRLDTQDKVITFAFGKLEGGGHYYFDISRQRLVIFDGDETLDLLSEVGFLNASALAGDTADDAMTVLSKVSDDVNATPTGRGDGVSAGNAGHGEREYLVAPDPEPSSSSSSKRGSSSSSSHTSSSSSQDQEDEDSVDQDEETLDEDTDGEGYDETDEYGEADVEGEGYDEGALDEETYDESYVDGEPLEYEYTYDGEADA